MIPAGLLARSCKLWAAENAALAALVTAVNAFLTGGAEKRVLEFSLRPGGAGYVAWVLYTE